jgi:predicted Zn-dependent protease
MARDLNSAVRSDNSAVMLRRVVLLLGALGFLSCGPTATPASRPPIATPASALHFSEVEREIGRRTDQMVLAEVKPYDDEKLAAYVATVLGRVTAAANADTEHWTPRVLDSSYLSVRSAPGGYVYVTRGLLAFLGSEADLAGALAHEVAHVTLRHWKTQLDFLEARGIEDGDLSRLSREDRLALAQKLRDDELRADAEAVKILQRAGYSSQGLAHVLRVFAAFERQTGGNRAPAVFRTHPATGDRLAALAGAPNEGDTKQDAYLSTIDGLLFGTDPHHGFLYGASYVNPAADFELGLDPPWRARLVAGDLIAAVPGRSTVLVLSRSENGNLEATRDAVGHGAPFQAATIAGHRALVGRVPQEEGLISRTTLIETLAGVFVLAVISPAAYEHDAAIETTLGSLAPVTDPAMKGIRPLRIRVIRLDRTVSLRELDAEKPSKTNLDTLALLNGVEPDTKLPSGTAVKRIDE